MKIKKKSYLAILLLTLMPMSPVLAQISQSILSELANPSVTEMTIPDTNEEEALLQEKRQGRTVDFEDESYGYTGGKNFINSPQEKFFDKPLSYFGYNFFTDAPTTFAPTNVPIIPDYLLGPGDTLKITLFGNKVRGHQLVVTREGDIFLPEVGPVSVAGLTFQDVREKIQQIVANQLIGTQASITLGELRSINIFVLGDAYQPGKYTVSALSTFTNAIFISGGVNPTGTLRNIQLKRNGKVVSTFDLYDLLLDGDTSGDHRLMEGDVVFVPPITKTVGISGEVGRPGIYELRENETLKDLIGFSGNLKPKADLLSATLQRVDPSGNGFNLIPLDLSDSALDSFELNNGDVLGIYTVVNNLKNVILMTGHAQQPGFFPWKEGVRIGDLIRSSDNLLSMTDLNYVLIKRKDKINQNYRFLQVDLQEVFKNDASDSNILLLEKDEIILFPHLLTPEQITTKLIQDKYVLEDGQMILGEDQWTSLTYLRKSLMDKELSVGEVGSAIDPLTGESAGGGVELEEQEIRRYYEYSIYHYCTIPAELAVLSIESSGFKAKKSILLEELKKLKTPDDIKNLQRELSKLQDYDEESKQIDITITETCRRQLLDPVIEIINRQITSTKEKRTIAIFGSVHFPGVYPLTEGMVLEDAIKSAGGSKDATYDSEVEISRSTNEGKKFSVSNSLVSISDDQAMGMNLQAMDVINLKQLSTHNKTQTVEITGEVYFPGVYPISENQTLGGLIQRAGGITEYGSTKAAYFQRQSLKEVELERLKSAKNELQRKILLSSTDPGGLGQDSSLDPESISLLTSLVVDDNDEEKVLGRLVVDLESIIKGLTQDVILDDGDSLHIPKMQQSIAVIGEVHVANSHLYKDGLSINEYINLSGGMNSYADESNIYLIKSNGSIVPPNQLASNRGFFRGTSRELEPGDTIVVPLEVQPFSGVRAATEMTTIIYQMALAAAAVNSF